MDPGWEWESSALGKAQGGSSDGNSAFPARVWNRARRFGTQGEQEEERLLPRAELRLLFGQGSPKDGEGKDRASPALIKGAAHQALQIITASHQFSFCPGNAGLVFWVFQHIWKSWEAPEEQIQQDPR